MRQKDNNKQEVDTQGKMGQQQGRKIHRLPERETGRKGRTINTRGERVTGYDTEGQTITTS